MMADERQTLYKVGDEVVFTLNGIQREGVVFIVDANGTFERPQVPSYDILVESENILYKHVPYDMVSNNIHNEYKSKTIHQMDWREIKD